LLLKTLPPDNVHNPFVAKHTQKKKAERDVNSEENKERKAHAYADTHVADKIDDHG
jgi:hypothetical protein